MAESVEAGLGAYSSLLRIPHVARSVIFGVIGQFPFPMLGMGLLIGIREEYASYTLAGVVSGAMAFTSAITAPIVGRLVDAYGQRRIGLPVALGWIAAIGLMSVALALHLPGWVLVVCGILLGTTVPFSSMLRARWTHVLRSQPGRLNSALSLTSTMEELMWVIGNPLGTLLAVSVALLAPFAAAILAIALAVCGFLLDSRIEPPATGKPSARTSGPARKSGPDDGGDRNGSDRGDVINGVINDVEDMKGTPAPSLLSPAFVCLLAILLAYGAFIASLNLSVVASAKEAGQEGAAGVVMACFSGASMIGALGYGARTWASPLWLRFYVGLTVVALVSSALAWSSALWMVAAILFVAGLAHAPTVVNITQLLIRLAPAQRFTEAMALLGSMFVVGMATSNLITGRVVDIWGAHGGFLTLAGFAITGLVIGMAAMRPIRNAAALPLLSAL